DESSIEKLDEGLKLVSEPDARVDVIKKEAFESVSNSTKTSNLLVMDPLSAEQEDRLPDTDDVAIEEDPGELPSCGGHESIHGGTATTAVKHALEAIPIDESCKPSGEEFVKRPDQDELNIENEAEAGRVIETANLTDDTNDVPLIPRRVLKNRASLYEVQGFDDYCKNISSIPIKKDYSEKNDAAAAADDRDSAPASPFSQDTRDKSKSGPHCHQRTLRIDSEDPEESSIDDHEARQQENTFDVKGTHDETSSIDRDVEMYETESEYSTTNTENQSASFSQSEGSSDIETNTSSNDDSERKDVLLDMKSVTAPSDHDLHMSATRRLRNQIDVEQEQVEISYLSQHTRTAIQTFSSEASTKTADTRDKAGLALDERLRSNLLMPSTRRSGGLTNKEPPSMSKSILAAQSMDTHLTSPLTSSFTMDTPLAAASTISSMRTFDHETLRHTQEAISMEDLPPYLSRPCMTGLHGVRYLVWNAPSA
ncbi:MAG: hypothetical protein SGILL_010094, partial [Bacillariaceae sp.]